ncbi:DUF3575 domain-containing protein [Butyricimonas sp.]|uniref:DUF3575 domain-containing protein n=1 Tax=Butyricimonas sp. TaxID=1969738 RepID=UPI0025BC77D8|nr:DUF3575 domain-containing protein [Butyricimonas sp.]
MYVERITIIVTLLLIATIGVKAQEKCRNGETEVSVNFRWDRAVLDFNYMGTGKTFADLAGLIRRVGIANIDTIVVVSYSSPEGRYAYNLKLSDRRAMAMNKYLAREYSALAERIMVKADGEAWHLFRAKVLFDKTLDENTRRAVLAIIDSDLHPDTKKLRLKALDGGRLYHYFIKNHFADLRRSFIRVIYFAGEPPVPRSGLTPAVAAALPVPVLTPVTFSLPAATGKDARGKKTIVALKTNLLYDLLTALNVEIEIPIGKRFSVAVEDVFPWWSWGPNDRKYCFQMWEMGVEPRWWFRRTDEREVLSGQFVGVYGMSAKYDIQWNTKWCYQGEYWSAGVTYGYAKKISRRFNLEFSASAGYVSGDYRHYEPSGDYEHLYRDRYKTGRVGYFGLTKLKVALVCPINIPVKGKKGGTAL